VILLNCSVLGGLGSEDYITANDVYAAGFI